MSKFLYLFALLTAASILFSCSEDCSCDANYDDDKTLVIVSDREESSELILAVEGSIRKEFPEYEIFYYQAKSFNIEEASYSFEVAFRNYPTGTTYLGIVEPGATGKKFVCKSAEGDVFIMPNNGLITRILDEATIDDCYYVDNPNVLGGKEYEDVMSDDYYKLAALAGLGTENYSTLGTKVDSVVRLNIQQPAKQGDKIVGELLFTDNFGNCTSNVGSDLTGDFAKGDLLRVEFSNAKFYATFAVNFGDVPLNENLAFIDGSGRLSFAVNYGNMEERYSLGAGDDFTVEKALIDVEVLFYNQNDVAKGIFEGMKARMATIGFVEGVSVNYTIGDAQGDDTRLYDLVNQALQRNPDMIVPISTPASQAAIELVPDSIPIVYTYVTDPESAGLVGKRTNVAGLSDQTNFTDYLNFVKELLPNLSKAGTIYNSEESNSTFAQGRLKALASVFGFELTQEIAQNTGAILSAYDNLKAANVETILIAADNTLSLGMSGLATAAVTDGIPVIGDSYQHARDGALAAISVDYDALAKATGSTVAAAVRGVDIDSFEIQRFSTNVIAVNSTTASAIGFTIPQDLLDKATYVFD